MIPLLLPAVEKEIIISLHPDLRKVCMLSLQVQRLQRVLVAMQLDKEVRGIRSIIRMLMAV